MIALLYFTENEYDEHFLLNFPQYDLMRTNLFGQLPDIPWSNITSMDSKDLHQSFLKGASDSIVVDNRMIIEATMSFFKRSKRFCLHIYSSNFVTKTSPSILLFLSKFVCCLLLCMFFALFDFGFVFPFEVVFLCPVAQSLFCCGWDL